MSRLIDADKLKDLMFVAYMRHEHGFISGIENVIDDCPTIDAVPAVRCKDCIYFNAKNSLETQGICMCGEKEMNYGGEFYPFADDYCSYGERRDEAEE